MRPRDQYEFYTDIIVNQVLPNYLVPMVYVPTGPREWSEKHLTNRSRQFYGIHLLDPRQLLIHPIFREKNAFDVHRQIGNKKDKVYCSSFEWTTFLTDLYRGVPWMYDIVFMSPTLDTPMMASLRTMLTRTVSKNLIRKILNDLKFIVPICISSDPKKYNAWRSRTALPRLFRAFQAIKLYQSKDYDWDFDELFNCYAGDAVKEFLARKVPPQTSAERDKLFREMQKEVDLLQYQLQKIHEKMPKLDVNILKRADEMVARCRVNWI